MPDGFSTEDFNEWIGELPQERQLIAFQRGCVAFGYAHSLKEDGGILVDGDLDDPDFQKAIHQEFLRMYVAEAFEELLEEGKIKAAGVDDNGEVCYVAVEENYEG